MTTPISTSAITPATPGTDHHDRSDPRRLLEQAISTSLAVVEEVAPDQMDAPTPCTEMDVRALLGHLVGVVDRIAALGRGDDPFAVVEQPAPGDAWVAALRAAADRAADAWRDDEVLDRPMALPWIQGSGAEVLTTYLSELTVHTWDLATATDQQPDWDDDVVAAALAGPAILPAENRRQLFEEISASMGFEEVAMPFAEAVTVADDAPAIDRLVAWNGRTPFS